MTKRIKRIYDFFRHGGESTCDQGRRRVGTTRLEKAVWELRHKYGISIISTPLKVKTKDGFTTIAVYSMEVNDEKRIAS